METAEIQTRLSKIMDVFSSVKVTNYEEAKAMNARIREAEGDLRALKRDINHHMKQIRAHFSAESTNVGNDLSSVIIGVAVGQKARGRSNSIRRQQLKAEKAQALEPYEKAKVIIDDFAHELASLKHELSDSGLLKKPSTTKTAKKASRLKLKVKGHYAHLDGVVKGPFSVSDIEALLKAGVADGETLFCVEGEEDWHPLSHFFDGV